MRIEVQYFAVFREQRGLSNETLETEAETPRALYRELQARHGFTLRESLVRVASNGAFASMDEPLNPGDHIVFIPPVAGG